MTDADTNLSNLTTLWLLLGAYMVFLMQVSDDFLFISYHPSFFSVQIGVAWEILKKCSETKGLKRRFSTVFLVFRKMPNFFF